MDFDFRFIVINILFSKTLVCSARYSKTLELMVRQRKMDIGGLGKILEWIAEDEQRHKTAIMMISEIASKQ